MPAKCLDGRGVHASLGGSSAWPVCGNCTEWRDSYSVFRLLPLSHDGFGGHRIQDLGVEVENIPWGCTGLCQPVYVGVNKPFKNLIQDPWEAWMIEEGLTNGTTAPPTKEHIVRCTQHTSNTLPPEIIRNAWRHGNYTWFPNEQSANNWISSSRICIWC